jgi:MOSC domain-containing protein YiiM
LLLITAEGIEELKTAGFPLYYGALGENITSQGLDRRDLRIGMRLRIGSVEVELTKPRAPCATIQVFGTTIGPAVYDQQVKAGDASSPRWGLGGFYFRVIKPGSISVGDSIAFVA